MVVIYSPPSPDPIQYLPHTPSILMWILTVLQFTLPNHCSSLTPPFDNILPNGVRALNQRFVRRKANWGAFPYRDVIVALNCRIDAGVTLSKENTGGKDVSSPHWWHCLRWEKSQFLHRRHHRSAAYQGYPYSLLHSSWFVGDMINTTDIMMLTFANVNL